MLKKWFSRVALLAILSLPVAALAQDAPFPDDSAPCGGPFGDPCVPIDGGLGILIAAGAAFGGKKAYDLSRKN